MPLTFRQHDGGPAGLRPKPKFYLDPYIYIYIYIGDAFMRDISHLI